MLTVHSKVQFFLLASAIHREHFLLHCLKKEIATAKELDLRQLGKVLIFRDRQLLLYINPGHYHNLIWFYNVFHQLTAKLRIGPHGPSAAQPAEVEPRREEEELFKRLRKEEPSVQLWRKRSLATLTDAQVISYSCEQIF